MIVCLCNDLNEQELKKITKEDFEEIQRCRICAQQVSVIFEENSQNKS